MTEAIDRSAARLLLWLYAANSFLFLVLSFFFLPDAIVKVVGSAGAVVLALLGLKGLNPREADTISLLRLHGPLVIGALFLIALLQAVLLGIGFAHPCRIIAIPGSTVTVDGKFLARTPDPTQEEGLKAEKLDPPENLSPWLKPRENHYLLRWDTHEIRISKRWYVDDDRSQESVKNVSVDYEKLWQLWNLKRGAFRKWGMITAQKPLLKISYGITGEPTDAETQPLANDVRSVVEGWDHLWLKALGQEGQTDEIPHNRTEPFVAALQLVEDHLGPHLEFQIRDWTDHGLKPLRLIQYTESDPSDTPLNVLRNKVFSQLLDELEIRGKITVSKADTDVANLKQTLVSSVATSAATPEIPGEGPPAEQPPATPGPAATVTASATPASSTTSTPNPTQVIGQLQTAATEAIKNHQLGVALAVQKQLQATLDNVPVQPDVALRLKDANTIIRTAIQERSRKGRIYIHIANESQREAAKKLQGELEKQFAVVGIQNVGGRAYIPDTAEVRYFAYPDPPATKQTADVIVAILRNNGVSPVRPSYVIPSDREKRESYDITTHFEIWFARDSFAEAD